MRRPLLALFLACGPPPAAAAAPSDDRPDLLWIVTDDQRPDSIAAYNRAVYGIDASPLGPVESPQADALAAAGTLFVNAFCQAPVCAPSRASLHTGRYPFRTGHYNFEPTHQGPDFVRPTVSQLLRERGYATASFGKSDAYIFRWGPGQGFHDAGLFDHKIHFKNQLQREGYGDLVADTVWDVTDGKWTNLGAGETVQYADGTTRRHFLSRTDGPLTDEDRANRRRTEEEFDLLRSYTRSNPNLILGGVNPRVAEETVDANVVREFRNHLTHAGGDYETLWGKPVTGPDPDRPVLMHLGLHLPHTPVLPPRGVRERFKKYTYTLPDFDPADLVSLPPQLKKLQAAMTTHAFTDAEKQQAVQDYYAFCAHGDALVGEAVAAFKAYAETRGRPWRIVYVVGDHGWHLGEQGTMAKFGPWRQSVNGAVIVVSSDDTVPAGRVERGITEYVDVAPTLLDAAGADLTDADLGHLDGFSLLRAAAGKASRRDYALGELNLVAGPRAYLHTDRFRFSMRTRPFDGKVPPDMLGVDVDWALTADADAVDLCLYDLKHDPDERRNVAADPAYAELVERLRDKLGRIVLGDGRIECDWTKQNVYARTDFAAGADDKRLELPAGIAPE